MTEIKLHDSFLSYIQENVRGGIESETIINGYDTFLSFLRDSHIELELDIDDDEALEDYADEKFESVKKGVQNSEIKWIAIEVRNNWRISIDGQDLTVSQSLPSVEVNVEVEIKWTEEENLWLKKTYEDLGDSDAYIAETVYQKALNSGNGSIIADCALRRAWSNDSSDDSERKRIECWLEAANKANEAGQKECYRWYEICASINRKHYHYSDAAINYEKAASILNSNCTVVGDQDRKKIIELSRLARKQYEMSGGSDGAARMYILENDTKLKNAGLTKNIALRIYKVLSNYGEAPSRVAIWAAAIIVLCAVVYSWAGVCSSASPEPVNSLLVSLYYSVVTFTTLGYGDFSPNSGFTRFISATEAVAGLLLTSLFMVTVVRKYSR